MARSSVIVVNGLHWRRAAVAGGAVVAISVAGLAQAEPQGMAPRPVLVSARHLTVRSSVGSFCTQSRPHNGSASGLCADYAYPLHTRGRLPVAAGAVIRLRFRHNPNIRDRIEAVHVALVRVSGDNIEFVGHVGPPTQNPRHASRWLVHLPSDLHHANVLDVSVRLPGGDADFWAGLELSG